MNIFSAGRTGDWRAWLARKPLIDLAKATGKWQAAPAVTLPA